MDLLQSKTGESYSRDMPDFRGVENAVSCLKSIILPGAGLLASLDRYLKRCLASVGLQPLGRAPVRMQFMFDPHPMQLPILG
jgi:hypothetical protein